MCCGSSLKPLCHSTASLLRGSASHRPSEIYLQTSGDINLALPLPGDCFPHRTLVHTCSHWHGVLVLSTIHSAITLFRPSQLWALKLQIKTKVPEVCDYQARPWRILTLTPRSVRNTVQRNRQSTFLLDGVFKMSVGLTQYKHLHISKTSRGTALKIIRLAHFIVRSRFDL